jgi:hypothetical protein
MEFVPDLENGKIWSPVRSGYPPTSQIRPIIVNTHYWKISTAVLWGDSAKASSAEIAALVRALGRIARDQGVAEGGYRVLAKAVAQLIRRCRIFMCISSPAATSGECCRGVDGSWRLSDRLGRLATYRRLIVVKLRG